MMKRFVFLTILAGLLALPVVAQANHAADPPGDCAHHPGSLTYHLNDSNNNWVGDSSNGFSDCVDGKAGADDMDAVQGADNLWGGDGPDTMRGGSGHDAMIGGSGNDILRGEDTMDIMYGDTGSDELYGAVGPDNLFGGGFCNETDHYGFDSFGTYDETNIPCGWGGADYLAGGEGEDWIWESNSDSVGDGFVDTVLGGADYDICIVEEIDIVSGCEEIHIVS